MRNNGITVITVPFDWRIDLSSEDTTNRLKEAIDRALIESNGKQITIITHSTGGIVVRDFLISNPDKAGAVKNFINIGGPNLGTPDAMNALVVGQGIGPLSIVINAEDARFISQNFPSVYQLLPGKSFVDVYKNYYSYYTSFYYDYTESAKKTSLGLITNYAQTEKYIEQYHNNTLYQNAKIFRNRIENQSLPSHIKEFRIIGYGEDTILSIMKVDEVKNDPFTSVTRNKYRVLWGGGDGTVPVKSADFNNYWNAYHYYFSDTPHQDLLANSKVHETIAQILKETPPATNSIPMEEISAGTGWAIDISCPVDIVVVDKYGNEARVDADLGIINEIPGLTYKILGGSKHFFIKPDVEVEFIIEGYDEGDMNISFAKYNGFNISNGIALNNMDITNNTTVNFNFDGSTNDASQIEIHYDKNGDGNVQILNPDTEFDPLDPLDGTDPNEPEDPVDPGDPRIDINVSGDEGNNQWLTSPAAVSIDSSITYPVEIEVVGEDGETTTITEYWPAILSYSINDGPEIDSSSLTINEDGYHVVRAYARDDNGSLLGEAAKLIKIDQTDPTLQIQPAGVSGDNGWLVSDVEVSIGSHDETSKLARVDYDYDSSGMKKYQGPFTETSEGRHSVYAESEDNAGNLTTLTKPFKIDKTKPVIADVYLQDEYYWDQKFPIQFDVSDAISGVETVNATINGHPVTNRSTYRFTEPGWHTYRIDVKDYAGWTATYETKFEVYIPAKIRFNPESLQLDHGSGMATNFIELPEPFAPENIDFSTVQTNEKIVHVQDNQYGYVQNPISDSDDNGITDMMLKYERESLVTIAPGDDIYYKYTGDLTGSPNWRNTTITMFGDWGPYHFKGYDHIQVSNKMYTAPPMDVTPPEFTIQPEDGAADVSVNVTPVLTISEPVSLLNNRELSDHEVENMIRFTNTFSEDVPFTANWMKNELKIQINPSLQLEGNQEFFIEIDADSVFDHVYNGNIYFKSSFTTEYHPIIFDPPLPLPVIEAESSTTVTVPDTPKKNVSKKSSEKNIDLGQNVSILSDHEFKDVLDEAIDKVVLEVNDSDDTLALSEDQLNQLIDSEKQLEIKISNVTFELDPEVIDFEDNDNMAYITFGAKLLDENEKEKLDIHAGEDKQNIIQLGSNIYHLEASVWDNKREVQQIKQFNGKIKVKITVPAEAVQAAKNGLLNTGRYNEETEKWDMYLGKYDPENNVFEYETDRFSNWTFMVAVKTFDDIAKHWAKNDIQHMASNGFVHGIGNGNFNPDSFITRAEFATLLVNILDLEKEVELPFTDVHQIDWFYQSVSRAYAAGLIKGSSYNEFEPNEILTREEMAVMICNVLKHEGITKMNSSNLEMFGDYSQISDWAKQAVVEVSNLGIVNGKPSGESRIFDPKTNTTRAEAVVVVKNLLSHHFKTLVLL